MDAGRSSWKGVRYSGQMIAVIRHANGPMLKRILLCVAILVAASCTTNTNAFKNVNGVFEGFTSDTAFPPSTSPGYNWALDLTQNGQDVTGTITAGSGLLATLFTGTITGTFSFPNLTFTVTVPAGSVTNKPGCTISLTGTALLSNFENVGSPSSTLDGTYTGTSSCFG